MKTLAGEAVIPKITDEELHRRAEKIKPLIKVDDGKYFRIKDVDLHKIAFTWSPKYEGEPVQAEEVRVIHTDHLCGRPSLFKPSIAEVLAQIPEGLVDKIAAFAITGGVICYESGNGHQAVTTLYKIK
jgi:hypothetical protein